MKISESIILGLIQGLTEFLPVSSSGHLVLFQNLFGIEEATQAFSILLHMATLIAVFVYYWRDIWALIRRPFQRTTALLIAGTIPTVIIALLFNDTFDAIFGLSCSMLTHVAAGGKKFGICPYLTRSLSARCRAWQYCLLCPAPA